MGWKLKKFSKLWISANKTEKVEGLNEIIAHMRENTVAVKCCKAESRVSKNRVNME